MKYILRSSNNELDKDCVILIHTRWNFPIVESGRRCQYKKAVMAAEKNNHHETATGTTTMPTTRYEGVTVSLVPEKKGLFLKHSEYEVCYIRKCSWAQHSHSILLLFRVHCR